MTERFQKWFLRNSKPLQYLVNERLAKRSGLVGRFFKAVEMGEREYGKHTMGRYLKLGNYIWMQQLWIISSQKPILSRLLFTSSSGALNYTGIFMWAFCVLFMASNLKFVRFKDLQVFNMQDSPEFWFHRYNLMLPPQFMNERLSAHYIEINHIYFNEMLKKYTIARKELFDEREKHSDLEKRTRYALNPNYIYEALGPDHPDMQLIKNHNFS